MNIQVILNKPIDNKDLTNKEAMFLMEEILRGNLVPVQIAAILTALRMKGESVEEILGFISVMRKHMVRIKTKGLVIDTCGTGGDGVGTFNISTAVAFVVAGMGIRVAKHGNRAASSLCGSADVLEALGVNINLTPKQAEFLLRKTTFTFLFAPLFHPAMKNVAPVRKELGIRTIFNYLGPFVSPAQVKRQIIGVPDINTAEKMAEVAKKLDYEHLLIVTSLDGLDEISISDKTRVLEIKSKNIRKDFINPSDFGLNGKKEDLLGGKRERNAHIIREIFDGKKGPKRDAVLINSAAGFYVAGKAKDLTEGLRMAVDSVDSGKAKKTLAEVISYGNFT